MTETFLKHKHMPLTAPGFKLYRKDRTNKGSGGVAVLIRDNFGVQVQVINSIPNTENIEAIALNPEGTSIVLLTYIKQEGTLKTDSEYFEHIKISWIIEVEE